MDYMWVAELVMTERFSLHFRLSLCNGKCPPALGANPFQGALPFTKKRELSPGLPPASPGSVALPHWTPPCASPTPRVTQTHVHQVSDTIKPSHPLLSTSPAFNLSQHQNLGPVVGGPCQGVRLRQLWAQRRPATSGAVLLPII